MTTHTRQEELAMMSAPEKWPHATVLPLTRPKGDGEWPEQGYLSQPDMRVFAGPPEPVVYLGNIWAASAADRFIRYASLEAVLDDGWRVD